MSHDVAVFVVEFRQRVSRAGGSRLMVVGLAHLAVGPSGVTTGNTARRSALGRWNVLPDNQT